MCMATPVKIRLKVKSEKCKVLVEGDKKIDISLVPEAKAGDWLLVHGNLAVNKISAEEAKNIFKLIKKCDRKHH